MTLVVHVKAVIDSVVLQLRHISCDVNDGHVRWKCRRASLVLDPVRSIQPVSLTRRWTAKAIVARCAREVCERDRFLAWSPFPIGEKPGRVRASTKVILSPARARSRQCCLRRALESCPRSPVRLHAEDRRAPRSHRPGRRLDECILAALFPWFAHRASVCSTSPRACGRCGRDEPSERHVVRGACADGGERATARRSTPRKPRISNEHDRRGFWLSAGRTSGGANFALLEPRRLICAPWQTAPLDGVTTSTASNNRTELAGLPRRNARLSRGWSRRA